MKKLSLVQMEVVEGGIACYGSNGVGAVMNYLYTHGQLDQWSAIMNSSTVMCYMSDGSYVNFWSGVN